MKERSKKERTEIGKRKRRFLAFIIAMLIGCLPTVTAFADSINLKDGLTAANYLGKVAEIVGSRMNTEDTITWKSPVGSGGGIKAIYRYNGSSSNESDPFDGNEEAAVCNVACGRANPQIPDIYSRWVVKSASVEEYNNSLCELHVELEAILDEYTITYIVDENKGENSSANPDRYTTGQVTTIHDAVAKTGFSFDGWYDNSSFNEPKITRITDTDYGNKTLYAKFSEKTIDTCTVTFNANGHGTAPAPKVVNKGSTVTPPAEPTAEGWTFSGWFLDDEGKNKYNFSNPVTENITLYAYWTKEEPGPGPTPPAPEDEYNISYMFYGFDGDSKKEISGVNNDDNPKTYKKNESVSLKDPSKSGYKFDAWYTDNKFTTKTDGIKAGETGDKDFYAKFIKDNSGGRDEDDDDDDDDDDKPFNPNPNALTAFYYLKNGMLDPSAKLGREAQGAVASNLFKSNLPAGWKEAFTFSLSINDKHTYTLKDGTIKLLVPEAFQKVGRKYAILAMGQNGVKFLSDTDTLPEWITVNPNVEGFAFELIYLD